MPKWTAYLASAFRIILLPLQLTLEQHGLKLCRRTFTWFPPPPIVKVTQLCPALCNPKKSQARILEWVAYPFFRASSQPRNWTGVSCIAGRFFTSWATRKTQYYFFSIVNTKVLPDPEGGWMHKCRTMGYRGRLTIKLHVDFGLGGGKGSLPLTPASFKGELYFPITSQVGGLD